LRTRASQLLPAANSWVIAVDGLVAAATKLKIQELQIAARPMGLHLMECAGNTRAARFGMISVGEWAGIPVAEILNIAKPTNAATQVLVSGFDPLRNKFGDLDSLVRAGFSGWINSWHQKLFWPPN